LDGGDLLPNIVPVLMDLNFVPGASTLE
jgi:hypothetical protein